MKFKIIIFNYNLLLPTTFTQYKESIPFASEERVQIIKLIAERIASIYAEFLTLNKHKQRDEGFLVFIDFPEKFPSQENVMEFREALKQTIISKLNKDHREIFLTTLIGYRLFGGFESRFKIAKRSAFSTPISHTMSST